jgi:protein gp37
MASERHWREPYDWNQDAARAGVRARVFCASMCDIMEDRPDLDLDTPRWRVYELVENTPNLDWIFLSKRPENYARFLPELWKSRLRHNVWLMTTVESQPYTYRLEQMMKVPAVVYGVSVEPMLSPVTLPDRFLNDPRAWVICGGESGAGVRKVDVRPMRIEWARALRDQTKSAGRPFHLKQWGWHDPNMFYIHHYKGRELDGVTWDEWPNTS